MDADKKKPVSYLSFLLRLWRTAEDSAWKASLEDPRTGQRMGFQNLDMLLMYLREQTNIDLGLTEDKPVKM